MADLLGLFGEHILGPGAFEVLKTIVEQATRKSWEDVFFDSFGDAVDQEQLRNALRYDLNVNVATTPFSTLTGDGFAANLARAMAERRALEVNDDGLGSEDYAQLTRNAVRDAQVHFREAVLLNQEAINRALLDGTLTIEALTRAGIAQGQVTQDLVRQLMEYIRTLKTEPLSEADVLAAAQQQLAAMPLDDVPDVATLPMPHRMPLTPNPLFVGREHDLRTLAAALKGGETTVIEQSAAVTGMGGLGKTQLAVEFAHRYGQYFGGGVFWLSFADAAAVPAEIAACGGASSMSLRPDFSSLSLDDQVHLVQAEWQRPLPRLLIFDNCEDEALLHRYRPTSGGCRVLVTSRRRAWDPTLSVRALPLYELKHMQSIALLCEYRSGLLRDDPTVHKIAHELGNLPLALTLAGSFLKLYDDTTPADYLDELRTTPGLEHDSFTGEGISPTGHDQSVARTFKLSYDRLNPSHPTDALALQLLTRAAYFASGEVIPRDLLKATVHSFSENQSAKRQVTKALRRLIDLGLIEEALESALRLHRLLAAFVRTVTNDAEAQTMVEDVMLVEIDRLNDAGLPAPLLALQPHFHAITNTALRRMDRRAALLCNELGYHLKMAGDYVGARHYYQHALAIYEEVQGAQHPDTATSLNNLGEVLLAQGDLADARSCLEQALVIWQQVLGMQHPTTAQGLNNLGGVLRAQGYYHEARHCFEQALMIYKQVFGVQHNFTALILSNLGGILQVQGDYVGARHYYEQALAIVEQVFEDQHPTTALILNNLGSVLNEQGDYAGARRYYEQALVVQQQMLVVNHPAIATSLNNLGEVLRAQDDLADARSYLEQALVIRQQVLGMQHLDTAISLDNLGIVLQAQGDLVGARCYYEQAMAIRLQVVGMQHFDTATSFNNMGVLCFQEGAFDKAIALLRQALAIFEQVFDPNHPKTQQVRRSLSKLQDNVVMLQRAEAAVARVVAEGNAEQRTALIDQFEQEVQQVENDEAKGAAYLAVAARLRALMAQLKENLGNN